jgi:hypothetical protein
MNALMVSITDPSLKDYYAVQNTSNFTHTKFRHGLINKSDVGAKTTNRNGPNYVAAANVAKYMEYFVSIS